MARDIDLSKKLSQEDLEWLEARYSQVYVDRCIELAGGVEKGAETASTDSEPPSPPPSPTGPENGGEGLGGGDEDLIGDGVTDFDPGQHTADEVLKHLKDASDAEKARVLALETDGKGRSTILNA